MISGFNLNLCSTPPLTPRWVGGAILLLESGGGSPGFLLSLLGPGAILLLLGRARSTDLFFLYLVRGVRLACFSDLLLFLGGLICQISFLRKARVRCYKLEPVLRDSELGPTTAPSETKAFPPPSWVQYMKPWE